MRFSRLAVGVLLASASCTPAYQRGIGSFELVGDVRPSDRGGAVTSNIVIFDAIYFAANSDRLESPQRAIADEVASTLQQHAEITLMEVQGHAAQNEAAAMALSARRAAAVRTYLMSKGVDGSRLQAQGYGKRHLLDRRNTEAARAKNRRVAFLILKRTDGGASNDLGVEEPKP